MSVSNGQLANAATFNGAFVSKSSNSTVSADIQMNGTLTQDKESVLKEIATPATPASGYGKIYFKADGKLYQLNDAGIETQVGTGTGGAGGVNFISNGNAEDNNTTGWATYADAAGSSPVDGTGGTANVTNTVTAVTPIAGTYSFLLAKDAVNRQGQGWSYDFTVAQAYRAKVLQISFDYLVNSGTFTAGTASADSDVTVWIYDVTNSQLIQPSSYKLLSNSASIVDKFNATFQSSATGSSYRIIFHVATTSASAYTLEVDNVSVSPSTYVYGTPVTDWVSYTPVMTVGSGALSNATPTGRWRRVGDSIEVTGKLVFSSTSSAFGSLVASLPSGLNIDLSKLGSGSQFVLGDVTALDATIANYVGGNVTVSSATSVSLLPAAINTHAGTAPVFSPQFSNTFPITFNTNDEISWEFKAPITGWSSSVQTSDQTDTRVVSFVGSTGSGQVLTGGTTNVSVTSIKDSHGAWTGSTYIVQVSGDYIVSGQLYTNAAAFTPQIYKNGSAVSQAFWSTGSSSVQGAGSILLANCVSGDVISLRSNQNGTVNNCYLAIQRLSGPSAIAATETVAAGYYASANGTTSTTQPVNFDSKLYDTHNAVTTGASWKFTAPVSGIYSVSGQLNDNLGNTYWRIYKNGTQDISIGFNSGLAVSSDIKLLAGEYIDIRNSASRTWSGNAIFTVDTTSKIFIKRVGN